MKILIIDDDSTSRLLLKTILQKWQYEVMEASDGLSGWEMLSQPDPPRLLIIDWMMPVMTGLELIKKISNDLNREEFYILMLTAKGNREDVVAGLEAGADDYVTKPWNNEELEARIKVGQRMLNFQEQAAKKQKLQGILEMAGAVCHELNQPLQVAIGYADMILYDIPEDSPLREPLRHIVTSIAKMGELTRKIMSITDAKSIAYKSGHTNIIDIHKSSEGK
ncbi:MAG: hypothetical protein Kow0029_31240 [Candidatus Rifleibacteriota bacterium]